jgi:hypothetical protein
MGDGLGVKVPCGLDDRLPLARGNCAAARRAGKVAAAKAATPGTRTASEAGRLGRASAIWQSPMPSKGPFRRRGGRARKLLALSAEVSAAVLRCPAAVMADPRVVWDSSVREDVVRRGEVSRGQGTAASARTSFAVEESAEAKVPAGIGIARKDEREAERQDVRASGRRSDRSQPFGSLGGRVRVKPKDARPERSRARRPHATAAHPPRGACGSGSRPARISSTRSETSGRTPVPRASTG